MKTKIDIKGINLKELQEMSEEEKLNFVKQIWRNETDKFYNKMLKQHIFVKTKDNLQMMIENEKYFKISKELWFDDEQPTPNKTKKYFINYNLMMNSNKCKRINEIEKSYFTTLQQNYYSIKNSVCVGDYKDPDYYEKVKQSEEYKRDMTYEEKQEYIKILKTIKCKYIERLSKYFDKYQQNINCCGFWVNR